MIKKIKEWLIAREKLINKRLYDRGYNWAAGELLRLEATPLVIQSYYECNGERNCFDAGAEDAVNELVRLGVVKDDRA